MKEITGINHVGIRVKDLAHAREFYERLGFEFIVGPVGPEPVAVMKHPSGVNLNFILNGNPASSTNVLMDVPDKHPGYTHIALDVTDMEAVEASLKSLGITINDGPIPMPGGAAMLFIRDPDANVIEFHMNGTSK